MPFLDVDDVKMYYETHGAGPPFLLLSGTGWHCEIWKLYQVPAFAKEYTVILLDYRGVGRSSSSKKNYSTKLFAEDASVLLDELNLGPAHVLGHSMGGRVAQMLALRHPRKVRSLVLAASGTGNFEGKEDFIRGVPPRQVVGIAKKGYEKYFLEHFLDETMFDPAYLTEHRKVIKEALPPYQRYVTPIEEYLKHVVARQMHETTSIISKIKAPTLVLVGSDDRSIVGTGDHFKQSEFLARTIPKAEFKVIGGTRHGYFWQMPAKANKIVLDFVRRH